MITDEEALSELRDLWAGMLRTRAKVKSAIASSLGAPGAMTFMIADLAHNLPFIQAFSVLNDILLRLREEGHFKCKSFFLGALLNASKKVLEWIDFELILEGVDRRNDVAHRGEILARRECWRCISAIEAELQAWGIIPGLDESDSIDTDIATV